MSELASPLRRSLRFARRQGWLVALVPVLALLAAALVVQRQDPVYRASMGIVVAQAGGNIQVQIGNQQTMRNILESDIVAQRVVERLGLSVSSAHLRRQLHVDVRPDSSVLAVSYDSVDGQQALRIVSEVGSQFQLLIREQLGISDNFEETGPLQIVADVIDPPHLDPEPIAPQSSRILGFAGILGLALGLVLAFARESLDDRIRERSDAEEWFGAPVVGTLQGGFRLEPNARRRRRRRQRDALELLRANVELRQGWRQPALLVTNAGERGGTATVVASLASALARTGENVLCVETDIRQPVLQRLLQQNGSLNGEPRRLPGLLEVLEGVVPLEEALQRVELPRPSSSANGQAPRNRGDSHVALLPAGSSPPDSADPAPSPKRLSELVSRLSTTADWVLIDSPALLSTGMTLSLAPAVDGVLVVAQHGRTRRGQAESVRAALASLGVEKVGVVLLNTPARQTASA